MPRAGGGGDGGGSGTSVWGGAGISTPSVPTYKPTEGSGPATPSSSPGVFSIDVTTPSGLGASLQKDATQTTNLVDGLRNFLFGTPPPKGGANRGGVPVISDIGRAVGSVPILGQAVGAAGNVAGGVGDTLKNAGDIVGGALEHIPSLPSDTNKLNDQFDQMPDSPSKRATQEQIAANPGIAEHLKYAAVKQFMMENQVNNPQLAPELAAASGSIADSFDQLFTGLGLTARPFQRLVAGTGKLSSGMNRLQEIDAMEQGGVYKGALFGIASGQASVTPIEDIAYQKWKSGAWTVNQALDFLTASGAVSHDTGLSVASQFALDPQVWGSLGAAGLAKMGATGLRLVAADNALISEGGKGFNVLRQVGASEKVSGFVRWLGKNPYAALQKTDETGAVLGRSGLGQTAKTIRYIIDPLHALGGSKAIGEGQLDLSAEITSRMVHETYGVNNVGGVLRDASALNPGLPDALNQAVATYSTNIARAMLLDKHVAGQVAEEMAHTLTGVQPEDVKALTDALAHAAPQDYPTLIKESLVRVAKTNFTTEEDANLAERMASMFGYQNAEDWLAQIEKMKTAQKGFLHAATYGRATETFLSAQGDAIRSLGDKMVQKLKLPRLILLNRNTLTHVGAQGIIKELDPATAAAEAAAAGMEVPKYVENYIKSLQEQYPVLARFGTFDAGASHFNDDVSRLVGFLNRQVEDRMLPMQLTDAEIKRLPQVLQDHYASLGGNWDYGFRPEDEKLLGLTTDAEGRVIAGQAWADHVAASDPAYRGTFGLAHNIAGQPIPGSAAAGKLLDYMDATAQTLKARVTATMITDSARQRFIGLAAKNHGMSEQLARRLFQAIGERAGLEKVAVRGLHEQNMWEVTRGLLPPELTHGAQAMTHRDMLNLVLEAYQGDLRFVGLTQSLTGRAKTLLGGKFGNFAGQMSENLYPKLRFGIYNPVFQSQERVEGIILNGQRGVNYALGNKLNESDRIAAQVIDNMAKTSFARINDIDMVELSQQQLLGGTLVDELNNIDKNGILKQLTDVKGNKRVNLLRTFEANAGKTFRATMNADGSWDRIVAQYSNNAGHLISDGDAAMRFLAEKGWTEAGHVDQIIKPGQSFADFQQAMMHEVFMPNNLTKLMPLNLDGLAAGMGWTLTDGTPIRNVNELRVALANPRSGITLDKIQRTMELTGFHPDYMRRVTNALGFDWNNWWRDTKAAYKLDDAQVGKLQDYMSGAARARGMTPADYMTQVFAPMVEQDEAAMREAMRFPVDILKGPLKNGTPDMLMQRMAEAFVQHLDPSAQDDLVRAFAGEVEALQVGRLAAPPGLARDFAAKVMARINGEPISVSPEVEQYVRYFSKWTENAVAQGLGGAMAPQYADLMKQIAVIPKEGAQPYNQMKALAFDAMMHGMRQGEADAFRLAYFARDRSWLERSINHPFFGLYPASYMWGKIAPELFHFIAKSPFGIRTGAAAYTANDLVKAMAIQREYDPNFEKTMNDLGKSEVLWFLGYMLPAVPWDIGSAAPGWVRDLAQQGLDNQARVDRGAKPLPIDLMRPVTKLSDYISPLRSAKQTSNALKDLGNAAFGSPQEQNRFGGPKSVPFVGAFPNQPSATEAPIQATGLQPVLADELAQLQALLSKP